jgi:hypothetical protein
LAQQHLDTFVVLDLEFSFGVCGSMVSLISLPAAIVGFRGWDRIKLSPQVARAFSNRWRKYSTCFGFMNSSSAEG